MAGPPSDEQPETTELPDLPVPRTIPDLTDLAGSYQALSELHSKLREERLLEAEEHQRWTELFAGIARGLNDAIIRYRDEKGVDPRG